MVMPKHCHLLLAIFCLAAIFAAPDPREAVMGTWSGKSICTNVRPACHDEEALYHVRPEAAGDGVIMTMSKVVDGKEVVMGELHYRVDGRHHLLTSEFERGDIHVLWTFHWNGAHMTGTLKQLPGGEVIRNITLQKK